MSLLGEKCERCGKRTKDTYHDVPTCAECQQEIEMRLQAENEANRACPVDGAVMAKEVAHVVVIDRCPKCNGVWLDAGEFERMSSDALTQAVVAMSRSGGYIG